MSIEAGNSVEGLCSYETQQVNEKASDEKYVRPSKEEATQVSLPFKNTAHSKPLKKENCVKGGFSKRYLEHFLDSSWKRSGHESTNDPSRHITRLKVMDRY